MCCVITINLCGTKQKVVGGTVVITSIQNINISNSQFTVTLEDILLRHTTIVST